jgi:hypothetical protein
MCGWRSICSMPISAWNSASCSASTCVQARACGLSPSHPPVLQRGMRGSAGTRDDVGSIFLDKRMQKRDHATVPDDDNEEEEEEEEEGKGGAMRVMPTGGMAGACYHEAFHGAVVPLPARGVHLAGGPPPQLHRPARALPSLIS